MLYVSWPRVSGCYKVCHYVVILPHKLLMLKTLSLYYRLYIYPNYIVLFVLNFYQEVQLIHSLIFCLMLSHSLNQSINHSLAH